MIESIDKNDVDYRAKRITAYLDLFNDLINQQVEDMKNTSFTQDYDEYLKFFELLKNEFHPMKAVYNQMLQATGTEKDKF